MAAVVFCRNPKKSGLYWKTGYKASKAEKKLLKVVESYVISRDCPATVVEESEEEVDVDLQVDERYPKLAGHLSQEDTATAPGRQKKFKEQHPEPCDDDRVEELYRD